MVLADHFGDDTTMIHIHEADQIADVGKMAAPDPADRRPGRGRLPPQVKGLVLRTEFLKKA